MYNKITIAHQRTSKKKNNLPIFLYFFILFIFLAGCNSKDNFMIFNRTSKEIVVVSVNVNGKEISKRKLAVQSSPTSFSPAPVYTSFDACNQDLLEIEVIEYSGLHRIANCSLNKKESDKCLFKVSYDGSDLLKCACDPYTDFKD